MKKIHITLLVIAILLIFLGSNFKNITNFYHNSHGQYSQATNIEGKYNTLLQEGNNFYTQSSGTGVNLEEQVALLEKSISSYSGALDIINNAYTEKNLEFVTEQLRVLKKNLAHKKQKQDTSKPSPQSSPKGKKDTQKKGENKKDGEKSGKKSGDKKSEGTKKGSKNGTQKQDTSKPSPQSSPKGKKDTQKKGEKNKDGKQKGLSEKAKKILEQKAKELEQQQGEIGKFYNKNYKEKSNSPFDNFADIFGRSIFDNGLLDDNQEKDW